MRKAAAEKWDVQILTLKGEWLWAGVAPTGLRLEAARDLKSVIVRDIAAGGFWASHATQARLCEVPS